MLYSFDGRRKRVGSKEKQVEERLQHRYKREMKGAIRDIKKDAQFLAAQKLQEQMQRSVSHMGLYMLAGVLSWGLGYCHFECYVSVCVIIIIIIIYFIKRHIHNCS